MRRNMKLQGSLVIGVLLAAFALQGCNDDDDNGNGRDDGLVRALHLSPDAPAVDVRAQNVEQPLFEGLEFGDTANYIDLLPDTYTLDVVPAGQGVEDSVLTVENFAVERGRTQTVIVWNELDQLQALTLQDNESAPGNGRIRVRPVHVAVAAPEAVDLWNITDADSPTRLVENLEQGQAGGFTDLDSGTYVLALDTDRDGTPDLAFDLPPLNGRTVADLIVASDSGGQVFMLVQRPEGPTARIDARPADVPPADLPPEGTAAVRAIHLSPDAPAVDVWINETGPVVTGLSFGEGTAYLELPIDVDRIDIVPEGGELADAVLTIESPDLEEQAFQTVVVYGRQDNLQSLITREVFSGVNGGVTRVRPIHVAVDVGNVDVWAYPDGQDPVLVQSDLPFGELGNAVDLTAEATTIGLDVDRDGTVDVAFRLATLPSGVMINAFAVTNDAGDPNLIVQLRNGTTINVETVDVPEPQQPPVPLS